MRSRMRRDLTAGLKSRDAVLVAALRSALAAIANAEAVDAPQTQTGGSAIAGAVVGLRGGEAARRELSDADVTAIVRHEIDERRATADQVAALGRDAHAARLRAEADVLAGYLPP